MADDAIPHETELIAALAKRDDLDSFGPDRRLVFAAQLMLGFDDVGAFAATSLTDGSGDKKCDVIHVDRDRRLLLIAQGFEAESPGPDQRAKQNKAAGFHQAATWVFRMDVAELPERIRPAVQDARAAVEEGAIDEIQLWFVHNLRESNPVAEEMSAVERAVGAAARDLRGTQIRTRGIEVGRKKLAEWFGATLPRISVTGEVRVPDAKGNCMWLGRGEWQSCTVGISADWLSDQCFQYGALLFTPNIRGFLGVNNSTTNINHGIRETLETEPHNLGAYNRGITAITHAMRLDEMTGELVLTGFAIVDGAQTTGAIANSGVHEAKPIGELRLTVIATASKKIVDGVVRNNNRQNPTQPADFRSADAVQERLRAEFEAMGIRGYTGGRRGSMEDIIQRSSAGDVTTDVVARALTAFHGSPRVACYRSNRIWESDDLYVKVFNDATSAPHALFCWSLVKAIEAYRQTVAALPSPSSAKKRQLAFLDQRGAALLLAAALGDCIDEILDREVHNRLSLSFGDETRTQACVENWSPIVRAVLPHAERFLAPAYGDKGMAGDEKVTDAIKDFRTRIESMMGAGPPEFTAFAARVSTTKAPAIRSAGTTVPYQTGRTGQLAFEAVTGLLFGDLPPAPEPPYVPRSRLMVLNDLRAVAWVLREQRAAFPGIMRDEPPHLGDELLIYVARSAYGRSESGRVVGLARVTTPAEPLDQPVVIGDRQFTTGCDLLVESLAAPWGGVPITDVRHRLKIFPRPDSYGVYLRGHTLIELPGEDAKLLRDLLVPVADGRADHLKVWEDMTRG